MIGLIGTAAGALALEVRRIRHRGSQEELKQLKGEERRLQDLLEATNRELERLKESSEAAQERAQQLQAEKVRLEDSVQTLQQNNTKLVLTNVMLLNKTKHLEESTRELVARTEDLQHQAEQTQRERMAELAALKERVSTVLNAYLSKDMELQAALAEMQAMGIELVPVSTDSDGSGVVAFETKLVLESPHRMQRLMSAAAGKTLALPASSSSELAAFALGGMSTDPTTGMPRVALGWRTSMQFPSSSSAGRLTAGGADAEQQGQDQAPGRVATAVAQLQDKSAVDAAAAKAASSSKQPAGKQKRAGGGGGFSLGWIGGGSPAKASSSSGSVGGGAKKTPVIVPSIRGGLDDDDDFGGGMGGGSRALTVTN